MRIGHQKIFQLSRYLPEGSEIIQLGTYKDQVAVAAEQTQEGIETVILYVYNKENYICGVYEQQEKGLGNVIYTEKLPFERVNYFKWVHLDSKAAYQLLIGGKRKEDMSKSELIAYQSSAEGVKKIPHEPIYFDEIELQKVDDKVQIVIWQNKVLEVYDILVYRLQDGEIVSGGWDESKYLNKVISYYKYLVQIYPGEAIYKRYLRELAEKREQLSKDAKIGQSIECEVSMDLDEKGQLEIENAEEIAVEQKEEAEKDVEPLEEGKKVGGEQGNQEETTDSTEGNQQVIVEDKEFEHIQVWDNVEAKQEVVGDNIDVRQESMIGSIEATAVRILDNSKVEQEVIEDNTEFKHVKVLDNTEAKQETMVHSTETKCIVVLDSVESNQEVVPEDIRVREEVGRDSIESKCVEGLDDTEVQQKTMLDNTATEHPKVMDNTELKEEMVVDNTEDKQESIPHSVDTKHTEVLDNVESKQEVTVDNTSIRKGQVLDSVDSKCEEILRTPQVKEEIQKVSKQPTCRGCEQYKMRCRWRKVCRKIN